MSINAMKMFLAMGEMSNQKETREDKLKFQERIVFATMRASIPDWQPPTDWDKLSIEVKEQRIKQLKKLNN
tara:strand:+ start:4037 stop:4249 length:213 start_codon:yes stop_codon:yes gene_type:complete